MPLKLLEKKLDQHFEKAGVVMVGMHQELQEQKKRLDSHKKNVDSAVEGINSRCDAVVSDLRSRSEAAVEAMNLVEPLIERIHNVALEANTAINSAVISLDSADQKLSENRAVFASEVKVFNDSIKTLISDTSSSMHEQQKEFKSDATALIDSVNSSIKSINNDTLNILESFSNLQRTSIDETSLKLSEMISNAENSLREQADKSKEDSLSGLKALLDAQQSFVAATQKDLEQSVAKIEERLLGQIDAQSNLLKTSLSQLSERQKASDAGFAQLKDEAETHRKQQTEFARKTRMIHLGTLIAGVVICGLILAKGF